MKTRDRITVILARTQRDMTVYELLRAITDRDATRPAVAQALGLGARVGFFEVAKRRRCTVAGRMTRAYRLARLQPEEAA